MFQLLRCVLKKAEINRTHLPTDSPAHWESENLCLMFIQCTIPVLWVLIYDVVEMKSFNH